MVASRRRAARRAGSRHGKNELYQLILTAGIDHHLPLARDWLYAAAQDPEDREALGRRRVGATV